MSGGTGTHRTVNEILLGLDTGINYCVSLGLAQLAQLGRFAVYRKKLREIVERRDRGDESVITNVTPYRVALTESVEFGELVPLLRGFDQDVVKRKLRDVLGGPPDPSDEDPRSSGPRNIQFELWLAGTLAKVGLPTTIGDSPDVTCRPLAPWQFFIECKRVFSPSKVDERIKLAAEQICEEMRNALPTTRGVIAISLSPVMNPGAVAPSVPNAQAAGRALELWLDNAVEATALRCNRLFAKGRIVAILYEAASDLRNFETGRIDRGRQVTYRTYKLPASPYNQALDRLCEGVGKLQTVF